MNRSPALRSTGLPNILFAMLLGGLALHGANALPDTEAAGGPGNFGGITDAAIRDVVTRVAQHQITALTPGDLAPVTSIEAAKRSQAPDGIAWVYPWGVTLYGLERSTDLTGDRSVDAFVVSHNQICARYYAWLAGLEQQFTRSNAIALTRNSKIKGLMTLGSLDNCGAMGTEMLETMRRHPDQVTPEEKAVVARIADWIVHKQNRLPDGTLWRPTSMGGTLWPDDLYMGAVFLDHWGQYTGDLHFIEDAAQQILHQAALEQDADGLWFHGYFVKEKQHAPYKWGRGNGWVTLTLVETLSALPENHPLRPQLLTILRRQVEGLKKVQAEDGLWRQVLDQPELWEETSCSAMFAYGIARAANRGWIDATAMAVARKAMAGIAKNVTADGRINGTCQGTSIGKDLAYYVKRPRPEDDLHGRGVVLLAGTEILLSGKK